MGDQGMPLQLRKSGAASLPASPRAGSIREIYDADAARDVATGGGSLYGLAIFDGTNWVWIAGEPDDWIAPTLQNSWVDFGAGFSPAGYYKDPFNRVFLRGLVKDGTSATAAIATLPVGYRPPHAQIFSAVTNPGVHVRMDISAAGVISAAGGSTTYMSLDGISFRAA